MRITHIPSELLGCGDRPLWTTNAKGRSGLAGNDGVKTMSKLSVAVIGAGMGGLATAAALTRAFILAVRA